MYDKIHHKKKKINKNKKKEEMLQPKEKRKIYPFEYRIPKDSEER